MILWVLLFLIFFVSGTWLYQQIQRDAGYLLINLNDVTIETSFWFAIFVVLLVTALCIIGFMLIRRFVLVFVRSSRWFSGKRHQTIERHYRDGLLHYFTGNWQEANKQLSSISRHNELPVVRVIAAAQSSAQLGNATASLSMLADAEIKYPEDKVWILKARLAILIAEKQISEADKALTELKQLTHNDASVENLELKLLMHKQQWDAATTLLPQMQKHKAIDKSEGQAMSIQTHIAALHALADQEGNVDAQGLDSYWQKVPKALKQDAEIKAVYAKMLVAAKQWQPAERYISKALASDWLPELVEIYAKLEDVDSSLQIKKAEKWLKKHPQSADLLFTLGFLSVDAQQWNDAKNYFEQVCKIKESAKALYFLGHVSEELNQTEQSFKYYKRAACMNRLVDCGVTADNKV